MTLYILLVTAIVSITAFQSRPMMEKLIFNPYNIKYHDEWYRLFSSGFIHANWGHLIINMLVLYSFGGAVESYYGNYFGETGHYYFIVLYIGGIITSILPTYWKQKENSHYNALGASGAVSAVLFASILFAPLSDICLYGLLCLPAIIMGVLFLAYSFYMDKQGKGPVNHGAHFWGALFGIIFTLFLKPAIAVFFVSQINNALHRII